MLKWSPRHRWFKWWSVSYIPDYLTAIAMFSVSLIVRDLPNHDRYLVPNDPNFMYPYAKTEVVPNSLLTVFSFVIPGVLYILIALLHTRSLHDLHNAYLGTGFALAATSMTYNVIKFSIGYKRPDYYSRVASGDASKIEGGSESFPSGHAGLTFAAYSFMGLYAAGKLRLCAPIKAHQPAMFASLVVIGILVMPFWVAATRVYDYRHHPADIIAGALIGVLAASMAYGMTFYGLGHRQCNLPLPRVVPVVVVEAEDDEVRSTTGLNTVHSDDDRAPPTSESHV
jgi:diacylglycerol diphosphate phosphatase/phosphatidate phosphatase